MRRKRATAVGDQCYVKLAIESHGRWMVTWICVVEFMLHEKIELALSAAANCLAI